MRRNSKLVYALFVSLSIVAFLFAYILGANQQYPLASIVSDIGVVLFSLVILDILWNLVGGEPLSNEIHELRRVISISKDAADSGLVQIISQSSLTTPQEFLELIKSSRVSIDIVSHTLFDIAERKEIWEALVDKARSGVSVRLIMNSVENLPSFHRYFGHPSPETLHDRIRMSSALLSSAYMAIPDAERKNLSISRLSEADLLVAIRRFDDRMYVTNYLFSERVESLPVFVIEGNSKYLFMLYLNELSKLGERSVPL